MEPTIEQTEDHEPFLSLTEAAALLKCHHNTVRAWVRQGKLEALRMGAEKVPMYRKRDVEALKRPLEKAGVIVRDDKYAFPVVGIGASAGGLGAVSKMLSTMPTDLGLAYVIVQHLEAEREPVFADLLRKKTAMPVFVAENGMRLKPDRVYVIPGGTYAGVVNTTFTLRTPNEAMRPIDAFFTQLADEYQHNAIGIVLSGTGVDGTEGMRAIRAKDGLTIAQDSTALEQGMPQNAQEADVVDLVLKAEAIGPQLADLVKQLYPGGEARIPGKHENELRRILQYLHAQRGIDFTQYKEATIHRRIIRRMVLSKCRKLSDYSALLHGVPSEVDTLCNDMLINVTSFFRDPLFFKALAQQVFPALLAERALNEPLRIWVPACAGGEEVVSIAVTLLEHVGDRSMTMPVQFFGTDLNERTIEKARLGIYKKNALQNMDPELVKKYFQHVDGHYQVIKPIREMCVFAKHDLLKDPPFSRMDLISCQNVLIYLEIAAQTRVIRSFHYALKPTGFLALGKSESVSVAGEIFDQPDHTFKVYTKKNTGGERMDLNVRYKPTLLQTHTPANPLPLPLSTTLADLDRDTEKLLLNRYMPASVLVSKDLGIVRFRGNTAPYLAPATGKASLNLLKMVREDLAFELRGLLQKAKKEKATTRKSSVPMGVDDMVKRVSLEVVPVGDPRDLHYLVLFKEDVQAAAMATPDGRKWKNVRDERERRIIQLEQELAEAREQMRVAAEEADTAQQELQSANEEVVSSNEELQSINEELETSKEELQSINEEFATINEELQTRNDALLESEERYRQLIHLMPVAVFTCDGTGHVRLFNEAAVRLWGRAPILGETRWTGAASMRTVEGNQLPLHQSQMAIAIQEERGMTDVEVVVVRPGGEERAVLSNPTPLYDQKGNLTGAINVLVDITDRKQAEAERQQLTGMLERSLNEIYIFDLDSLTFDYVNHGALSNLGYTLEQMRDMTPVDIKPELDARQFDALVEPLRSGEKEKLLFLTVHRRADGSDYPVEVHLQIVSKGPRRMFMAMILDITERKLDEERLGVITRTGKLGIWDWDILADTIVWTDPVYAIHGVQKGSFEPSMEGYHQLIHPEDREQVAAAIKATLEQDAPYEIEFRTLNAEGTVNWVYTNAVLIREQGRAVRMMGGTMNITARREAEDALRISEQRYHVLADNLPQMIYIGDLTGKTIWVNDRWSDFTGLSSEDVLAGKWAEAVHPDDAGPMMDSYRQSFAKEEDWEFTFRIRNKEGRYRWFLSRCVPLRGAQGEVLRWFGTNTDVTEQLDARSLARSIAERKDFLLRFNDTLRPLQDPLSIQEAAARLLAEMLDVARVAYFEVQGDTYIVARDHGRGVSSIEGRYPTSTFGVNLFTTYCAGLTASSSDVHTQPELSPTEVAAYDAINISAYIGVPLVKEGVFVAGLAVHSIMARTWTAEEIALAEETAERTWASVERARAESALRKSEERYRSLFSSMDQGFCVIEMIHDEHGLPIDYRFLEMNSAFERHTGLVNAIGRTMRELVPDIEQHWFDTYDKVARTGEAISFEQVAQAMGDRWFEVHAYRVDAGTQRVAILFSDVSERKRAAEQLQASEERFRLLSDNIGELAWIAEPDGAIYWYNKRWFEFTGTTLEEMQDWGWKKIYHPEYVDHTTAKFKYHIEQGIDWQDTFPILGADGKYRWFLSKARPVRNGQGTILRWFGTNTDITELRETEDRLRESEANFRLLADNMDQLAMILDAEGIPTWFNRRWEPTLGVDFANLSREERMEWMHPDDVEHMMEAFLSGLSSQKHWDATFRMRVKNGEYRWFLTRSVPVIGSDGQLVSWFTTNTDITETKQAQHVVQEREARLMIAASAAELGIFERRFENDQAVWENDRMFAIFGRTREEGVVPTEEFYRDVLHPEDREMAKRGLEQAIADIGNYNITIRIRRKNDGAWRTVEVASRVEADIEGKPWRLVGVMADITERELDSQAARRLAAIVASTQDAVISKDLNGIITSWNQAATEVFVHTAEETIGRSILILIPEELHSEEATILARLRKGERIEHYETVRLRKDGTRIEVALTVSPIITAEGVVIGASKVARDISERKRLEQDITTANAQLRMVTDHMPVAVARVGRDQRFLWASQGYLDWIGLREEQVEGKHLRDVIGEAAHTVLLPYKEQVLKGEPVECEVHVELRGRGKRWLDLKYAPLYEEVNVPNGWIEVITDITMRKGLESALRAADEHKDHFLATLAHELRNPLAPIKNGLHLLELSDDDPEMSHKTQAMMARQVEHMVRLVDDLMDLSRISRGKIDLVLERVDLDRVIATAMEASDPLIKQREHQLSVTLPQGPWEVRGDVVRLTQVVANLLNNSAKYTDRGGRIELRLEREGNEVAIHVKDNGIGIAATSLPLVFDMFAQVSSAEKNVGGGLGIGLNIVKRLVEMHAGRIEARSEGLGYGSEFILWLPLLEKPSDPKITHTMEPEQATTLHARRILVVDDNEDAALTMALILKKRGHAVEVAHDGLEAVERVPAFRPQIVFMDIGMPRMNGYEACAAMRALPEGKDVLIVALSGWGQEEDKRRAEDAGFDKHLVKPIDGATLLKVISADVLSK